MHLINIRLLNKKENDESTMTVEMEEVLLPDAWHKELKFPVNIKDFALDNKNYLNPDRPAALRILQERTAKCSNSELLNATCLGKFTKEPNQFSDSAGCLLLDYKHQKIEFTLPANPDIVLTWLAFMSTVINQIGHGPFIFLNDSLLEAAATEKSHPISRRERSGYDFSRFPQVDINNQSNKIQEFLLKLSAFIEDKSLVAFSETKKMLDGLFDHYQNVFNSERLIECLNDYQQKNQKSTPSILSSFSLINEKSQTNEGNPPDMSLEESKSNKI